MNRFSKEKCVSNMVQNLPILRAMLHMSQAGLSEKLGVSRQQIVALETGKRTMTWTVFLALLLIFRESKETEPLLFLLGIYSDELKQFLITP